MNRCYFGAILLILLLALSLGTTWAISRCQTPVVQALGQASAAAAAGNTRATQAAIRAAEGQWQHCRKFAASVVDHGPMESIDGLFAQLPPILRSGDLTRAASLCRELQQQVKAIIDAHRLSLWNFL